jgi:DNA-directed RNA polymerase sigma subunit (sigma70/sigma32)
LSTEAQGPRLATFQEQLDAAYTAAARSGELGVREYEALLVNPDFDEAAFERFRNRLRNGGLALPEEEEEPSVRIEPRGPQGGAERELLDIYLDDIGRFPLLSHPDLLDHARRARAGDQDARKRIILANLRLVVHLARGYRTRGMPMLDLIEEGNLGLIHAADRFEPERRTMRCKVSPSSESFPLPQPRASHRLGSFHIHAIADPTLRALLL